MKSDRSTDRKILFSNTDLAPGFYDTSTKMWIEIMLRQSMRA